MKTFKNSRQTNYWLLLLPFVFLFAIACSSDDDDEPIAPPTPLDAQEDFHDVMQAINESIGIMDDIRFNSWDALMGPPEGTAPGEEFNGTPPHGGAVAQRLSTTGCMNVTIDSSQIAQQILRATFSFGDSCTIEQTVFSGSYTFEFHQNELLIPDRASITFNNLGIDGATVNGTVTYQFAYSVSSNLQDSITRQQTTKDIRITGPDRQFTIDGTELFVLSRDSISLARNYSGTVNGETVFTTSTQEPIIYTMACERSISPDQPMNVGPVSGIERLTITNAGQARSFTVNYGNGACESIYTVTDDNGYIMAFSFGDRTPVSTP